MEYKDGTVFELCDNKQKFIVLSTIDANSVDIDTLNVEKEKSEECEDVKESKGRDFLVVAPMGGTSEDPIIHNANPVIMQPSGEGMNIILDEKIIKNVLLNI
jgi:hypothetical protein